MAAQGGGDRAPLVVYDHPVRNVHAVGLSVRSATIYLTTGLIQHLSDDALRAILAHEEAHVRERHILIIVEGFTVTSAADGVVGVAEALGGNHDIVVLDVMMPKMSGVEVLREIRLYSRIPVLMLTARRRDRPHTWSAARCGRLRS